MSKIDTSLLDTYDVAGWLAHLIDVAELDQLTPIGESRLSRLEALREIRARVVARDFIGLRGAIELFGHDLLVDERRILRTMIIADSYASVSVTENGILSAEGRMTVVVPKVEAEAWEPTEAARLDLAAQVRRHCERLAAWSGQSVAEMLRGLIEDEAPAGTVYGTNGDRIEVIRPGASLPNDRLAAARMVIEVDHTAGDVRLLKSSSGHVPKQSLLELSQEAVELRKRVVALSGPSE